MKLNHVYIISWIGNGKKTSTVLERVNWWLSEGFTVTLIAQEWDEIPTFERGVTFIDIPQRMSPAAARNIALMLHYQSNDDFAFISDDDVVLTNYRDLVENLRVMSKRDVDLIDLLLPKVEHVDLFKVKDYFILKRLSSGKGGLFLMKNMVKFGKEPIMFDVNFKWREDGLIYGEDFEFVYNLIQAGHEAWNSADLEVAYLGRSCWSDKKKLPKSIINDIYIRKYGTKVKVNPKTYCIRKLL